MFIPDTDFLSIPDHGSRIPESRNPKTAPNEKGESFFCPTILCSHKYHKIVNNFLLNRLRNFLAKTLRIIVLFTQKVVIKLSKIWVWDQRSGKNLSRIQGQKGTGSRIRIRNTVCNILSCYAGEPAGHVGGGLRGCGRQQQQRAPPHTTTRPRHRGPTTSYLLTCWGVSSVPDPWHFGVDPDLRIHASD